MHDNLYVEHLYLFQCYSFLQEEFSQGAGFVLKRASPKVHRKSSLPGDIPLLPGRLALKPFKIGILLHKSTYR